MSGMVRPPLTLLSVFCRCGPIGAGLAIKAGESLVPTNLALHSGTPASKYYPWIADHSMSYLTIAGATRAGCSRWIINQGAGPLRGAVAFLCKTAGPFP